MHHSQSHVERTRASEWCLHSNGKAVNCAIVPMSNNILAVWCWHKPCLDTTNGLFSAKQLKTKVKIYCGMQMQNRSSSRNVSFKPWHKSFSVIQTSNNTLKQSLMWPQRQQEFLSNWHDIQTKPSLVQWPHKLKSTLWWNCSKQEKHCCCTNSACCQFSEVPVKSSPAIPSDSSLEAWSWHKKWLMGHRLYKFDKYIWKTIQNQDAPQSSLMRFMIIFGLPIGGSGSIIQKSWCDTWSLTTPKVKSNSYERPISLYAQKSHASSFDSPWALHYNLQHCWPLKQIAWHEWAWLWKIMVLTTNNMY